MEMENKRKQSEMKNTLEEINSRLDEVEDEISDLEDSMKHTIRTATKKKKEKESKENKDSLRGLWDNIKHNNICTRRVPEGGESTRN